MTSFEPDLHPRVADGTFATKQQSAPESAILSFIAGEGPTFDGPWDLAEGDMVIYSHAEGDFDAAELRVEGIEVWRDERKKLHAAAYTDLDFIHLAPTRDVAGYAWLEKNKTLINEAVWTTYGRVTLDDANGDWEIQKVVIDISQSTETFPGDLDGVIDMAEGSPFLAALLADLPTEGEQPFWGKIRAKMDEIQDDHAQELAGIRNLGRQGRI